MSVMRAKMRVQRVTRIGQQEDVELTCVGKSAPYPEGGYDEDNTFALFTPCGSASLTIMNPELYGVVLPDDVFYVDFTKVENNDSQS